ncbi:cilia- and flagella-associated protein 65 [Xenentodon cancila]
MRDSGIHHRQCGGTCQRQASGQKSCFLGLETKPELVWEDWDLGKEFTETLVLKNIHNKLKKLYIRPPVSTFFSSLSPQKVVIRPGTSFSIPVIFRPLQRCEYEDSIEFQSEEGSFHVYLRAIVPCHILELPDSVTLPICAVQDCSQTNFLLKNVSQHHTAFQWDCAEPFQLSPEAGVLKPGQERHIRVVFRPQMALVYQQQVYCRYGEEGDKTDSCCGVLVKGLAKYPYLELRNHSDKKEENHRDPVLHFGSVAVGQRLCKHFDIFNPSPVNVSFSLSGLSGMVPVFGSAFGCDVTSGKVAPGGSLQASVTYSPTVVDTVSVDYLALTYKGALKETQLKLIGKCIGTIVCLSSSLVDFGCVKEGASAVQTLDLINSSPVEAIYQWDIDCSNSVFSILPVSGTVLPHSQTKLRAVYEPTQPMAHHRRVACLILHRDPVFLDLIGTCHTELHKPAILKPEHLALVELHGSPRQHSPNSVSALQHWHNTHLHRQRALSTEEQLNQTPNDAAVMPTRPMDKFCKAGVDLSSKSSSSSLVSVVPSVLLFNHKKATPPTSSSAFSQSVSITNHGRRKLSLVWTISPNSPFAVSPSFSDLAPLKSTSFRVTYDPKQLNTLHGAQLECFAYYKDDLGEQLCPPWSVTVRVIGHSFQLGKEHFTPRCSLKPHQVEFPAVSITSYRTVLLQNDGELPLTFYLDHRKSHNSTESVHVQPACGFIRPGDHQILTVGAVPTEDSPKQGFSLFLQLNAAQFTKELTVVSVAEKPCVSLESGSSLCFHPTAVGSETQLTHRIRNLSRLSIWFQWNIPEQDQELIIVKPDGGELHPNDSSIQMWSFHPLAERTYTIKPTLTFWPVQSDGSNKTHLTLEVCGIGSKGSIEAESAVLDVGEILVGSYQTVEVALVNRSPCPVSFRLSVQQMVTENQIYDSEAEQCDLKLDCERGTIASRSKMLLQSTCRPGRQAQYLWTISYQTLNSRGLVSCPPQALCEVQAKGVFPTLQVIDACCGGSVGMLSKVHLWNFFTLDNLNEHLLATPSPAELTFQAPMRHSLNSCPSIFTKSVLDFNFSSAPLHSDSSDFVLMFYNPGSIPVDWAFLFPKDQQIDLEYWAVTGEFSSTELDHLKLQDNRIFSVSPRAGTLLPGHKRAVHFSYRHDFAGIDRLPVVFKLSHGREILLNFQGVTVERNKPYLHFASTRHAFSSVAIGDNSPPRQMYELHNGGAVPVHYEVDAAVLSQLQENNFNHPLLCCLNPEGDVLPGKTAVLEWIFSPLEAKMYRMDVPIHIQGTNSTLVRFEGCGLDTSMQDSSNTFTCRGFKAFGYNAQKTPFPGQVLFLSDDSICLGNIFVSSQSSRILFLTNVSQADTAHYVWELPQQGNQQVVQIHPERGRLRPGECVLCVVTFTPTDYPTIYQLNLICQTLPPISASCSWEPVGSLYAKQTRAEHQLAREKAKVWRCPEPPKPALLHLSVSARTHELPEKLTHCPDQYVNDYRYHQLIKTQQPVSTSAGTYLPPTSAHGPEREIAVNILTSLLRNILDDSAFIQSLIALASKPKIYQPARLSTNHFPSAPSPPCLPTCLTSSTSSIPQAHIRLNETMDRDWAVGCLENNCITRSPELVPADTSEVVLLNTLQNVMMEAVRGELVLTSYPRSIILPPVSLRSRNLSRAVTEEENTSTAQRIQQTDKSLCTSSFLQV